MLPFLCTKCRHNINWRFKCPVSSIFRYFSLKQTVKHPTRENAISDFCNTPVVCPPVGLSYHNLVICSYKNTITKNTDTKMKIRQGNNNWTALYRTITCEQKLDLFVDIINAGLDCFLPIKTVKLHDKDKPWVRK